MTTDITLSMAVSRNPMTEALVDGLVKPEGITPLTTTLHGSEMFWRQLRYSEFDVSDMSLSSMTIAYANGHRDWVAIPVFTMRKFFHTWPLIRKDRGIRAPADLKGRRIGVAEYQQTAAIWARGILEDEFGVMPKDIEWWMERGADKSHGHATGFQAPPGVTVKFVPPQTNIGEMVANGELDGTLNYITDPNLVDRSRIDLSRHPDVGFLFADRLAECKRYFAKTGIFPINHTIVLRRSLYEKHPWMARSLYEAFHASAWRNIARARAYLAPFAETGLLPQETLAAYGGNLMPYGMAASRPVLETVTRYVFRQGLCTRPVALEEMFAAEILDT